MTDLKNQVKGDGPSEKTDDIENLEEEILRLPTEDIVGRYRPLDSELRILRIEATRINNEMQNLKDRKKENQDRIKVNKTLPYLVSNVIELLDLDSLGQDDQEGANVDLDASKTKCAVIKTSTRATYFLPVIGLVDATELKPGDLVGVNKDSHLILEKLRSDYDSRVKAMEVDERPIEQYSDIGGLDKQIQELIEAVVLPMTHAEKIRNIGIQPPKGVLLYGPPETGKTMMARAAAAQMKSTFLKLASPQLVQMFIGDGAKLVRDAFALAKEKAPAIIFIDELDAIGMKCFDSERAGDREVQRTMLELLNQLDGISSMSYQSNGVIQAMKKNAPKGDKEVHMDRLPKKNGQQQKPMRGAKIDKGDRDGAKAKAAREGMRVVPDTDLVLYYQIGEIVQMHSYIRIAESPENSTRNIRLLLSNYGTQGSIYRILFHGLTRIISLVDRTQRIGFLAHNETKTMDFRIGDISPTQVDILKTKSISVQHAPSLYGLIPYEGIDDYFALAEPQNPASFEFRFML